MCADPGAERLVVDFGRTGHFRYESGHHGDTWLELDRLFVDQSRFKRIAGEVAGRLRGHEPEVICGPLIGGALLAQWVAHRLDLPFVYAERILATGSEVARYRLPAALSNVVAGRRVAIVDDAVNAGAATLATREEIVRLGGSAMVAAAIFIRLPGGIALLETSGLAVEYLVGVPFANWEPADCPLCRAAWPLERMA